MKGCIPKWLKTAWNGFLDLLFPRGAKCLLCGKEIDGGFVCDECESVLPYTSGGRRCIRCSRPLVAEENFCPSCSRGDKIYFDLVSAPLLYEGATITMVHRFKFGRRADYADYFGALMSKECANLPDFDVIVPVPSDKAKVAERGYNQCDLLAKSLQSHLSKPICDVLITRADVPDQVGLTGAERRRNKQGSIKVKVPNGIKGRAVLVVDDVLTTGSTMSECARALKKAGATAVYGITLAITPTTVIDKTKKEAI
jgi:ComF family protein